MDSHDTFAAKAKQWDQPAQQAIATSFVERIRQHRLVTAQTDLMEIGCGTGLVGLQFANKVKSLTMVDTSEAMLNRLRDKITPQDRIEIVCGDIHSVTSTAQVLLVFMALHHMEDMPSFFQSAFQHLRTGGHLFIGDLYTEDGSFHGTMKVPYNGFSPSELESTLLSAGFGQTYHEELTTFTKDGRPYTLFFLCAEKGV